MENSIYFEVSALFIGIIALIYSVNNFIKIKLIDKKMKIYITERNLDNEIDKFIRIRNANQKYSKRILSNKEYLFIINKINDISNKLDEKEKDLFESTLKLKNESDRLNYIQKLLSESSENSKFERFEIQKWFYFSTKLIIITIWFNR